MSGTFLHDLYARLNADVAEAYGVDSPEDLRGHFTRYGVNEIRGTSISNHMNIEGMLVSDTGCILLNGWADRRVLKDLSISVDMGFIRYNIDEPNIAWYHRADVAEATGDADSPCGFVMLFQIENAIVHPRLSVHVNGWPMLEQPVTRLMSIGKFLDTALGTCAVLADRPIGDSLSNAHELTPVFERLWRDYLESLTFTRAFERRQHDDVDRSIIITIYKRADMLLRQLEELAPYLTTTKTEVIVVGNELLGAPAVISAVGAFCQIHPIDISIHLCTGNSGFSVGNNYGAEMACGDVLIFMNPDVFPPEGGEERAFAFFESDPEMALHGALMYYGNGMLMHSGMYTTYDRVVSRFTGECVRALRVEHFGKGLSHFVDDETLEGVFDQVDDNHVMASAALWKIRKSVFEAAGGLPDDYIFAYYEDADFCMEFLSNGGEIVIDEESRWLHLEGVGKAKPPAVRTFMWLNRARFTNRFEQSELLVEPEDDRIFL